MAARSSSRGPSHPPSTRPARFTMSFDPVLRQDTDQIPYVHGTNSEDVDGEHAVMHPGVSTIGESLLDPRLRLPGNLSVDLTDSQKHTERANYFQVHASTMLSSPAAALYPVNVPKDEFHHSPTLQQTDLMPFEPPMFGNVTTGLTGDIHPYGPNGGLFNPHDLTLRHAPWNSTTLDREGNLPGDETMPMDQTMHFSTTAAPIYTQGLDDANPFYIGCDVRENISLSPSERVAGRPVPVNPTPQYGVPDSNIFDFELEFGSSNISFANADLSGQQALLSDPALLDAHFCPTPTGEQLPEEHSLTAPTHLPSQEQLELEFQVALVHELPRPTMEALDRAAREGKQKNFYDLGIDRKTSVSHRAPLISTDLRYDHVTPPSTPSPMSVRPAMNPQHAQAPVVSQPAQVPVFLQPAQAPVVLPPVNDSPRFRFIAVGDYRLERPASDLIRDARSPHPDDYSQGALVYRIATSTTGRQTNFTFNDHYHVIINCLRDELVDELNRKLRVDLPVHNLVLLRDIFTGQPMGLTLRRRVDFAQKPFQRRIDWMNCPQHYSLMDSLNPFNQNLGLVEMDRLVKATGVWVFENWQATHPWEQRGSR
ncbi:hypothetical protein PMIN04_008742 [Paraphaeosphaeria minitans]